MDNHRIGLIGALCIVAIALIGAIVLSAKGIPVPAYIAGPLTVIGTGFAWLIKPPGDQKADASKDGAQ